MVRKNIVLVVTAVFLLAGTALAGNDTLILYYSKMGKTRIVADELKVQIPDADLVEIKSDVGLMKGAMWYQLWNKNAEIEPIPVDVAQYDTILICSPIWFQKISSPVRTVLNTMPLENKKVSFFITCGGHFGTGGQERLMSKAAERRMILKGLSVIKTGGKPDDEIRKQVQEEYKRLYPSS